LFVVFVLIGCPVARFVGISITNMSINLTTLFV